MENDFLYVQIANALRKAIMNGKFKPGDSFPPVRSLAKSWNCTIGTVQRAFQILASEGLVTTHIGRGTKVLAPVSMDASDILRKANIVHRIESFLLEILTEGFTTTEIEDSFEIAIDRWKKVANNQGNTGNKILRFSGSHDLLVAWLATHFPELFPGNRMLVSFSGSMPGLKSLNEGKSDIAGIHLWDETTVSYNLPFVRSIFPGEKLALVTLAERRIGWMMEKGNPKGFSRIEDLTEKKIRFVNRNPGSGTRIFLDSLLMKNDINSGAINGYKDQKSTHSEIAATIFEKKADIGLGLEAAAEAYNLDFIFLNMEQYDLVMKQIIFDLPTIQRMIVWFRSEDFRNMVNVYQGYDLSRSGLVYWT
jgi:putative molybdopterin biosynthesis protein